MRPDKKDLAWIARWNWIIEDQGHYIAESDEGPQKVIIQGPVLDAMRGSLIYTGEELSSLVGFAPKNQNDYDTQIEVVDETTVAAILRLDSGGSIVTVLNFASAKKAGGGYLNGAVAQEEALCRCSGLHACLTTRTTSLYYGMERPMDGFYHDHMIWSPDVPFYRNDQHQLLPRCRHASVVTSPAPNISALSQLGPRSTAVRDALSARAGKVLALAHYHETEVLVLGAWGCGVFGNDPAVVADVFAQWLKTDRFKRAFERVVFAIPTFGNSSDPNLVAFRKRFGK
jgi:uncharacterized protein (TIGR02452 family)